MKKDSEVKLLLISLALLLMFCVVHYPSFCLVLQVPTGSAAAAAPSDIPLPGFYPLTTLHRAGGIRANGALVVRGSGTCRIWIVWEPRVCDLSNLTPGWLTPPIFAGVFFCCENSDILFGIDIRTVDNQLTQCFRRKTRGFLSKKTSFSFWEMTYCIPIYCTEVEVAHFPFFVERVVQKLPILWQNCSWCFWRKYAQ